VLFVVFSANVTADGNYLKYISLYYYYIYGKVKLYYANEEAIWGRGGENPVAVP
jgi:hypothetical protein